MATSASAAKRGLLATARWPFWLALSLTALLAVECVL